MKDEIERQSFLSEIQKEEKDYQEFKKEFETLLMQKFGITIGDCTSDEDLRAEFKDGGNVQEYVDFIGEKHDLNPL